LATNSIKLRFGTANDPHGSAYIWIDPPWLFYKRDQRVASAADYDDNRLLEWSNLFRPLDHVVFREWNRDADGAINFVFGEDYRIVVPRVHEGSLETAWYVHWYASERTA
jgi:hypothetical protein